VPLFLYEAGSMRSSLSPEAGVTSLLLPVAPKLFLFRADLISFGKGGAPFLSSNTFLSHYEVDSFPPSASQGC